MIQSGSPLTPEDARIRRYRGEAPSMFRAAVRASMTDPHWRLLLASVDQAARAFLERPSRPEDWVDAQVIHNIVAHLQRAKSRLAGQAPCILAAEREASGGGEPWTSPGALFHHLPELWASRIDGGRLVVEREAEGSATIALHALASFDYFFRSWFIAWLRRSLELAGVRRVRVEYRPPMEAGSYLHRYDVSWE